MVSVALSDPEIENAGPRVVLAPMVTDGADAGLEYEAYLGAGVRLGVDLAAPHRWNRLSVNPWGRAGEPIVRAVIGERATQRLHRLVDAHAPSDTLDVAQDGTPWLRVAVVDALDRWLHLPLEQALVDAERGIARLRAAITLPADSDARAAVVGDALGFARRASADVTRYLRRLVRQHQPLPAALKSALRGLVDGYSELRAEVDGDDHELSAVVTAWGSLSQLPSDTPVAPPAITITPATGRVTMRVGSLIDPRQVRARVFALSGDPATAEITLDSTRLDEQDAVLVRVPAFGHKIDPDISHRLLVRLVNRRSGGEEGHALLTASPRARYFRGAVALGSSRLEDLRADVYDVLSDVPPARTDSDIALQEVRHAILDLRERRSRRARAKMHSSEPGEFEGPGGLLVAEFAAAHEERAA